MLFLHNTFSIAVIFNTLPMGSPNIKQHKMQKKKKTAYLSFNLSFNSLIKIKLLSFLGRESVYLVHEFGTGKDSKGSVHIGPLMTIFTATSLLCNITGNYEQF